VIGRGWILIPLCWVGFMAAWLANWDFAWLRALLLLGFAAATAWMLVRPQPPSVMAPTRVAATQWVLAALALAHLAWFAVSWFDPHPGFADIGVTTLAAASAISHGLDPYTLPIDPQHIATLKGFEGYKYTPVMALAYLPLGAVLGARGLLLTNLLADLGVALVVNRLATRTGGQAAGLVAAALYLSIPFVPQQLFQLGVTDLISVLALMVGLTFHGRSAALSGFFMGLSVAAKPFPGLIAAAYGLSNKDRLQYLAGCAVGVLPVALFLIRSARALIDNTILYNLIRPPDTTAWLTGQPIQVAIFTRIIALTILITGAAILWRRGTSLQARCCWTIIGVIASILAGPSAHTNYLLWWAPLFCTMLATVCRGSAVSIENEAPATRRAAPAALRPG